MLPTSRDKALTPVLDRLESHAAHRGSQPRLRIGCRDGAVLEGAAKAISVREVALTAQGERASRQVQASDIQWIRVATRRWTRMWAVEWELWFDGGSD